MSIQHSSASCDWCRKKIDDGEDAACQKCYEQAEGQIYDLKIKIEELKAKIDDLESRVEAGGEKE